MTSRIGLLGGTFDPPHLGHLWLAESAREQLSLDTVRFLPVGRPPHKLAPPAATAAQRLQMVSLAIGDNAHFSLDATDLERPPPHTTATLLPMIRAAYPESRLWLLIGADSLRDLSEWQEPDEIIRHCRLAALARPGVRIDWGSLEATVPGVEQAVDLLTGPVLDVSSTEIRQRAGDGRTLRYLLPEPVRAYIIEQDLYLRS
jgi:nicotinate-nucleotide adenylyltransferase